ncbi:uncharacterized protein LOC115763309 isoform X2 [Drosophila novamexicana]|uniref:uncharacterized protein LOC115763309 isoform X2 n=1 Tax=Drosophila novamexicana TaxID=47314 RepID=UPI0011E598F8|nr:uncharacterized protein LOC115763309 isoform X2 [Drosophila novamexicana]
MEQSEKRLKTELNDEDFIVPDHGRGYNADNNMKTEPIAGEDDNDDPLSDNDCDIGPIRNQFFVANEAIETPNEGINELTQPQNKLTKDSVIDELLNMRIELRNVNKKLQNVLLKQDHILQEHSNLRKAMTEMCVLLKMNLSLTTDKFADLFPLQDEENLQYLEGQLQTEQRPNIIRQMRKLLCANITENFSKIFSEKLILSHNYDGIQNKKPIKVYEHFIAGLFASDLESREEFVVNIRSAYKINKNRIHKSRSRKIKKRTS